MQWNRVHQGNVRQKLYEGELEQATPQGRGKKADDEDAVPVGISPRLHVPEITLPEDEGQKELHGDVEGSPYSSTPGRIGLQEAAEEAGRGRKADEKPQARTPETPDARASKK